MRKACLLLGFKMNGSSWKPSEADSIPDIKGGITTTTAGLLITEKKMKVFLLDANGELKAKCLLLQSSIPTNETKYLLKREFGCEVDEDELSKDLDEISVIMDGKVDKKKEDVILKNVVVPQPNHADPHQRVMA